MGQYLPIFAMLVLALVFAGVSRTVSNLEPPERFPVRFFLVAMIFIVFDIEIIFLFPFATVFRELGGFGIGAIVIFSAAVFESFVYLISKGALDWGPVKRMQRSDVVSPGRTTTSTIRRVGLEGREPATVEEAA